MDSTINNTDGIVKKASLMQMVPVMLCFFAMGFVDLIGTASNYVKDHHHLTETEAGYLPMLVFFWFLIISVPTGLLMNKIGRKKTVLLSLIVTTLALVIPICGDGLAMFVVGFSFLGIGNAIMQTSLNPLVSNLISDDKLASTLTFGQFVKAIASFLAPIVMTWGAMEVFPTFGLGWRGLFALYAIISFLTIAVLGGTPIKEEKPDKASGIWESVKLLGFPFVFLCFIGIFCHVGIDVGVNTYAPKVIMERVQVPLEEATFATSLYFIFRTGGTFLGTFFLRYMSQKLFFLISVVMMIASMVILFSCHSLGALYVGIALVGFGNSNIFAVVFSQALNNRPKERNEVSGLMIMGLFGGAVFPVFMSYAADFWGGVAGAIAIMSVGVLYLLFYTFMIKKAPTGDASAAEEAKIEN